jgi:transposase, IS5 family
MAGQRGFWDVEERLKELSAVGDPLEKLGATVDFELFRPVLRQALGGSHPSKGGRPGFDPVPIEEKNDGTYKVHDRKGYSQGGRP